MTMLVLFKLRLHTVKFLSILLNIIVTNQKLQYPNIEKVLSCDIRSVGVNKSQRCKAR